MKQPNYNAKRYNTKRIQTLISEETYSKLAKKAQSANMSLSAYLELIIEFNNDESIDTFLEFQKSKKNNEVLKNALVNIVNEIDKIYKKHKKIIRKSNDKTR